MKTFLLAKMGVLQLSISELDHMPLACEDYFLGFGMGVQELEQRERRKAEAQARMSTASRGRRY